MTDTCSQFPQVLAVALGGSPASGGTGSYWQKALDYLAGRGRKQVAVLATALNMQGFDTLVQEIQPLLTARGMHFHPQGLMPFGPMEGARVYVQALLPPRQQRRPDALIITDDNLVEPTLAGLLAAGVRVGTDLDIVAHCNFPWTGSSAVPVKRLGFDVRNVLQRCLELIDRQRHGATVPAVTTIEAKFEDEPQPTTEREQPIKPVGMKGTSR